MTDIEMFRAVNKMSPHSFLIAQRGDERWGVYFTDLPAEVEFLAMFDHADRPWEVWFDKDGKCLRERIC